MNKKYKPEYVESDLPPDQHEHQGWFWHMASKKFYRWNDLPHRKEGIMNELISIIIDVLNTPVGRFIAMILCLGLPAWALIRFDDYEY